MPDAWLHFSFYCHKETNHVSMAKLSVSEKWLHHIFSVNCFAPSNEGQQSDAEDLHSDQRHNAKYADSRWLTFIEVTDFTVSSSFVTIHFYYINIILPATESQ